MSSIAIFNYDLDFPPIYAYSVNNDDKISDNQILNLNFEENSSDNNFYFKEEDFLDDNEPAISNIDTI